MRNTSMRLSAIGSMLLVLAGRSKFGSTPTAPSSSTKARLHNAKTLTEFVQQIKTEYNYTFADAALYDHGFGELPGAVTVFRSDDPLQETWLSRPDLSYPADNGRFTIGPRDPNRK